MGLPCLASDGGIFVWADFGSLLFEDRGSWEAEAELFEAMAKECKVVLTPGSATLGEQPGWFRLCFASVPRESLVLALDRIERFAGQRRKENEGGEY